MKAMAKQKISDSQEQDKYTDEEIEALGEWYDELTLKQAFFLKESYENYLKMKTEHLGVSTYVH